MDLKAFLCLNSIIMKGCCFMSELKIKGIWPSKEILDISERNIKEKMILALSINLYKSNKKCFVSNIVPYILL